MQAARCLLAAGVLCCIMPARANAAERCSADCVATEVPSTRVGRLRHSIHNACHSIAHLLLRHTRLGLPCSKTAPPSWPQAWFLGWLLNCKQVRACAHAYTHTHTHSTCVPTRPRPCAGNCGALVVPRAGHGPSVRRAWRGRGAVSGCRARGYCALSTDGALLAARGAHQL